MAKVFITQVPNRRDEATKTFVPTVNISPASEYGDIVVMMPANAQFHATGDLIAQMRKHLKDYDYEAGDCIVSLGDPAIVAVAFGMLGAMFGKFTILKWDKHLSRYLPSRIIL